MTVSKDYNKHVYEGNGLTVDWPYDFDLPLTAAGTPDTSLIHVFRTNLRGEVSEVTTGYSINAETGTLTCPTSGSPLESGEKLTILRLLDVRQQFFDPSNQANLYPETLEDNTDRLVMMIQQLQEETDRAVKVGLSTDLDKEDTTAEGIFEARDIALSAAETAEGYANMLPAIADELDVNIVLDEADLRAKLAAIGASNASLVIATTIPIAADLAIPSNVALSFKRTGQLQPAVGTTLTINGAIEAGLWQIFDGNGVVSGKPDIEGVYPEWFGAKGDGVPGVSVTDDHTGTDDFVPITRAIRLASGMDLTGTSFFIPVVFQSKTYIVGSTIVLPKLGSSSSSFNVMLQGSSRTNWPRSFTTEQATTLAFPLSVNHGIAWAEGVMFPRLSMDKIHLFKTRASTFNSSTKNFDGDAPTGNGIEATPIVGLVKSFITNSLTNCAFSGWGRGISIGYGYYSVYRYLIFNDCDTCFYHQGLNNAVLENCNFRTSLIGVYENYAGNSNRYRSCYFEWLKQPFYSYLTDASVLDSCYFESNAESEQKITHYGRLVLRSCHIDLHNSSKLLSLLNYRNAILLMESCAITTENNGITPVHPNIYCYSGPRITLIHNTYTANGEVVDGDDRVRTLTFSGDVGIVSRVSDGLGTPVSTIPRLSSLDVVANRVDIGNNTTFSFSFTIPLSGTVDMEFTALSEYTRLAANLIVSSLTSGSWTYEGARFEIHGAFGSISSLKHHETFNTSGVGVTIEAPTCVSTTTFRVRITNLSSTNDAHILAQYNGVSTSTITATTVTV